VSLRDDLAVLIPRLRRYAQALSGATAGSNEIADALVQQTLKHALEIGAVSPRSNLTTWLYSLLTQFHRNYAARFHNANVAGENRMSNAQASSISQRRPNTEIGDGLAALTLDEREAFLLVVLEGLSYGQASSVLRISRATLVSRLLQSRHALGKALPTSEPTGQRHPSYLRVVK